MNTNCDYDTVDGGDVDDDNSNAENDSKAKIMMATTTEEPCPRADEVF